MALEYGLRWEIRAIKFFNFGGNMDETAKWLKELQHKADTDMPVDNQTIGLMLLDVLMILEQVKTKLES